MFSFRSGKQVIPQSLPVSVEVRTQVDCGPRGKINTRRPPEVTKTSTLSRRG